MTAKSGQKVTVRVHPGSRQPESIVEKDGLLHVYTKAPAAEGRANESVKKILAKHFGIASTRLSLVIGSKSKLKTFKIL